MKKGIWVIILLLCVISSESCRRDRRHYEQRTSNYSDYEEIKDSVTIIGNPDTSINKNPYSKDALLKQNAYANHSSIELTRKAYSLSYNQNTLCPNWVAWYLTAEHVDGDCQRDNAYYEDDDVPFPKATNADYRRSGWSRGHMCPAGDNKWDAEAMRESNLLTNMCPQNPSLNSGLWNVIERDCRKWAKKYGGVYIVCGPVFLNTEHETIGENKISVPEAFFKVILRMYPKPAAIGFVVRNNEGKKKRDQFVNSVDEVERITGMDFFPSLPDDIEEEVEAHANLEDWK